MSLEDNGIAIDDVDYSDPQVLKIISEIRFVGPGNKPEGFMVKDGKIIPDPAIIAPGTFNDF